MKKPQSKPNHKWRTTTWTSPRQAGGNLWGIDESQNDDVRELETPTSLTNPVETRRLLLNDAARRRYAHNPDQVRQASRTRYHANPDSARGASQRQNRLFREVKQEWDIDHPCRHCGYIWLKSSEAGLRKKCCQNGILCNETSTFILLPLPEELEQGFFNN